MGTLVELEALCRLVNAAGLKPVIDSVHALADARTAFERLESGQAFGKVVVETTGSTTERPWPQTKKKTIPRTR